MSAGLAFAAPPAQPSSDPATLASAHPVAQVFRTEFKAFYSSSSGHIRLSALGSQFPALAREFANMQSPSDPSHALNLNFGAATEEVLSAGPMILIPGAEGACVLMQVPAAFTASKVEAVATCNTAANIATTGGIAAEYIDVYDHVDIAYGMQSNETASALLLTSKQQPASTVRIKHNGYAISVHRPGRLVFHNSRGGTTRVENVGNAGKVGK